MPPPQVSTRAKPSPFQTASFLVILVLVSVGFLYMVRQFLLTVFMAAVFSGLTYSAYQALYRRLRLRALAAATALVLFVLLLVLPATAVLLAAYQEAIWVLREVDFAALPERLEGWARQVQDRFALPFLETRDLSRAVAEGLQQLLQTLVRQGAGWSVALATIVAKFFLMLLFMFYFYVDGARMVRRLIRWSPLRDDYEWTLIRNFLAVSRATLKGILIIGVLQGVLGALMFWILGLGAPVLLGVLIVITAVIPVLGSGMVWGPAALYLLLQGRVAAAVALVVFGVAIISTVDNVLRPIVVGRDIRMHDMMVLLSTLGGLFLFGLPGFVAGPMVASLFLSIWKLFEEMFSAELARNETGARHR